MAVRSTTKRIRAGREALDERMDKLSRLRVTAGVQGKEAAQVHAGSDLTNGALAVIHERGVASVGIQARPTHRPGIAAAKSAIERGQRLVAARAIKGGGDIRALAEIAVAEPMVQSIQHEIRTIQSPPLKLSTIARRRRAGDPDPSKPLYFTHQLHDAQTGKAAYDGDLV